MISVTIRTIIGLLLTLRCGMRITGREPDLISKAVLRIAQDNVADCLMCPVYETDTEHPRQYVSDRFAFEPVSPQPFKSGWILPPFHNYPGYVQVYIVN